MCSFKLNQGLPSGFVSRWNSDGTPDNTFTTQNQNSITPASSLSGNEFYGITYNPTGIYTTGYYNSNTGSANALCQSFETTNNYNQAKDSLVFSNSTQSYSIGTSIYKSADNSGIFSGIVGTDASNTQIVIGKINGITYSPDPSFNNGTSIFKLTLPQNITSETAYDLIVENNGDIITVGSQTINGEEHAMITKITKSDNSGTGIGNLSQSNNLFNIYPNPAHDMLNIKTDKIEISSIVITNSIGQIVTNIRSASQIDCSNLATGIYFMKINNEFVLKFLKE